jgi:sugar phosphate isomerase/epimerase
MKLGTLLHPHWLAKSLTSQTKQGILGHHVRRCLEAGAEHIELTGELFTLAPDPLLTLLRNEIHEELRHLKEREGLSFSVHLPYMGGLDVSSSIHEIREATLGVFRRIVELTRPIEPLNFVLHIAGMLHEATSGDLTGEATQPLHTMLMNNVISCLDKMSTFIDPERICIENLPTTSPEFLARIVGRGAYSICLDIGHLIVRGDPLEDFLAMHSEKIREVHLHDVQHFHYAPYVHLHIDHQSLGQGQLPIPKILDRLSYYGFSGPLVLETLRDSGTASIKLLKELLAKRTQQDRCAQ